MRRMQPLIAAVLASLTAGCAVPFPEPVTPREAFVKYPGAGVPHDANIVLGFPLGLPVTIVEDAR